MPSRLILRLLVVFTQQLEILVTTLLKPHMILEGILGILNGNCRMLFSSLTDKQFRLFWNVNDGTNYASIYSNLQGILFLVLLQRCAVSVNHASSSSFSNIHSCLCCTCCHPQHKGLSVLKKKISSKPLLYLQKQ